MFLSENTHNGSKFVALNTRIDLQYLHIDSLIYYYRDEAYSDMDVFLILNNTCSFFPVFLPIVSQRNFGAGVDESPGRFRGPFRS